MKIYDVMVPGCREKFETWIRDRGGVQVWRNLNLSNPGAGNQFTPATMVIETARQEAGYLGKKIGDTVPYPNPHWSVGAGEVVTDIKRFRFVKSFKELKRIRVALRRGSGLNFCLTDGSQRKLDRALDAAREKYEDVVYRKDGGLFDYERFIVVEVPEWEAL
uniref:Uncharacterized protein n=1 Tax=viral metagenome TaxID=1070528 RepID=A0A6M3JEC9_9ZZZZ